MLSPIKISRRTGLLLVLLTSTAVIGAIFNVYLLPQDEGTINLSAQRILSGELPHRDYHELYTGLLSYLNAASHTLFGDSMVSPRITLMIFTVIASCTLYTLMLSFAAPPLAVFLSLAALLWGPTFYFAALPTWYCLYFAIFATFAVFRFIETEDKRWLALAGFFSGAGFLFKIIHLFVLAAIFLFLLFYSQRDTGKNDPIRKAIVLIGLTCFALGYLSLFLGNLNDATVLQFLLPMAIILATAAARELRTKASLMELISPVLFVLGGFLLPLLIFGAYFFSVSALGDLINGVFVGPAKRLDSVHQFLKINYLSFCLMIGFTVFVIRGENAFAGALRLLAVALGLAIFMPEFRSSLRNVLPLSIPLLIACQTPQLLKSTNHKRIFAIILLCLYSLVQFPYYHPIYFMYCAPLLLLAVGAVLSHASKNTHIITVAVVAVLVIAELIPGNRPPVASAAPISRRLQTNTELINLPRGGLKTVREVALVYNTIVPVIEEKALGGTIFAFPDCSEIYFLTGKQNPTPWFFELLSDHTGNYPVTIEQIKEINATVLVLNHNPQFTKPIPEKLFEEARKLYPFGQIYQTPYSTFEVRWIRGL